MFKFAKAYYYHFSLLGVIHEILFGPREKRRYEATMFGYSQPLNGWTVMDQLHEIQVPTLVMAGRYDFLYPPEHQAILADRIPNASLDIIECAGHNPQMERPAEVIEVLRHFLADVKSS